MTESREEKDKQHTANVFERPAEQQRLEQAKEEAAATVRCPKPQPGEDSLSYLEQSVGTETQPRAQHAAAQRHCEGQDVLTVRCETLEDAGPKAECTIMAGGSDREIVKQARDIPSLCEKPKRKEKLEGGATVGAACATTVGLAGKLLSMAERLSDQS